MSSRKLKFGDKEVYKKNSINLLSHFIRFCRFKQMEN